MKFKKLRGRIIEKYGSIGKFAEAIGKSRTMLSYKLNGKTQFTMSDIRRFCELLDISGDELGSYFFAD